MPAGTDNDEKVAELHEVNLATLLPCNFSNQHTDQEPLAKRLAL